MPRTIVLIGLLMPLACGGGDKDSKEKASIENALSHVIEGQEKLKAKEEGLEKIKEKAAAEAEKAREQMYATAVALPTQMPENLQEACASASAAYDTFMQGKLTGTALDKWNLTKQVDLDKGLEHCKELRSLEVAACQTHALTNPPPTATDESGRDLMLRCESKFGPAKGSDKVAAK